MRLKRVLAVFLALTLVWGSSRISGMSRADEAAAEMTAAAVLDSIVKLGVEGKEVEGHRDTVNDLHISHHIFDKHAVGGS